MTCLLISFSSAVTPLLLNCVGVLSLGFVNFEMSVSVQGQMGPGKGWELSFYDLQRTPQEAITDHTEIAVSPRALQSELMCPICLDMLKKTMTTKECLHRFCSDCIITALRSGNKECPTCRKKLVSKRSLRPDPNFDLLIGKIYPGRNEGKTSQGQFSDSARESNESAVAPSSSVKHTLSDNIPDSLSSQELFEGEETEVVFRPNPTEMLSDPLMKRLKDSMRYIKTPDHATIDHLSKYLAMRLTLDNIDSDISSNLGLVNFCIYIAPGPGQMVLLNGSQTLKQVKEKYWKANKPLEMFYSINKKT